MPSSARNKERLLRATAMDELPQLWSIFRGDMSFVGPRALMAQEIEVNGGFFFNEPATTAIYTLSLHDALPILQQRAAHPLRLARGQPLSVGRRRGAVAARSEEHTSELQSRRDLVCRLLLEKKKNDGHPDHRSNEKKQGRRR